MNKQEFLTALQEGLKGLPQADIQHRIEFYREMIEDRMEDGMSEEEAVAALGPVRDIVAQILSETPLPRLVRERVKPKRPIRAWEIVLLVLGSPMWVPLLFAGVLVILACYATLWACIISLYAVDLTVALCGLAGLAGSLLLASSGELAARVFLLGSGLACLGLAMILFFVFNQISVWILHLSKKALLAVKFRFVQKEAV